MTAIDFRWSEKATLPSLGIAGGSTWMIVSPQLVSPFGVATNDVELARYLSYASGENYYISTYLMRDYDDRLRQIDPELVGEYAHMLVCSVSHLSAAKYFEQKLNRRAFVDTKPHAK